jgi:hypothetical protein
MFTFRRIVVQRSQHQYVSGGMEEGVSLSHLSLFLIQVDVAVFQVHTAPSLRAALTIFTGYTKT